MCEKIERIGLQFEQLFHAAWRGHDDRATVHFKVIFVRLMLRAADKLDAREAFGIVE